MTGRLQGKVAIVTGAGAGLGRAMVLRFAAEGARVIAASRSANVEEAATQADGEVVAVRCDVGDPDQVAALHDVCRERYGRLDVLCNNAGIAAPQTRVHETPLEDWDRVMAVNARGMFLVLRQSLRLMLDSGGGSVVMMGSVGAHRGSPGAASYSASKGAVLNLTRTAALEYARDNIRVNAICPGIVRTPLLEQASPEVFERLLARIPQGRLGMPEEVAALALFLASDESTHITGASYVIDGGRCAA